MARITFDQQVTHTLEGAHVSGRLAKAVLDAKSAVTVRLQGIDAPESSTTPRPSPRARSKKPAGTERRRPFQSRDLGRAPVPAASPPAASEIVNCSNAMLPLPLPTGLGQSGGLEKVRTMILPCLPRPFTCDAFVRTYADTLWDPGQGLDRRLKVIVLVFLLVFGALWLLSFVRPDQLQRRPARPVPARSVVGYTGVVLLLVVGLLWWARACTCWLIAVAPLPCAVLVYWLPTVVEFLQEARVKHFAAAVVLALLYALLVLRPDMRWAAALAALPAVMVILQYVFLWLHRPRETPNPDPDNSLPIDPGGKVAREDAAIQRGVTHANEVIESHYGQRTLFVRYGLPAMLLLIEGIVLAFVLLHPELFFGGKAPALLRGARFGTAGAYAWVLVELGQRSFRRDVTPGVALWAIVTLALGPMLAAIVALVWVLNPKDSSWQSAIVLFYTGYAPRNVLTVIEQAALQMLRPGAVATVEIRSTPLTKLRGIDLQVQQRLLEEGIPNVESLATAEPIRLVRNTSFDLRQILWWVDEALLMIFVPRGWEMLEENGVTGAIDLADLYDPGTKRPRRITNTSTPIEVAEGVPNSGPQPPPAETTVSSDRPPATDVVHHPLIAALAQRIGIDVALLEDIVERVYFDHQVRYIWTLYNRFSDDGHAPAGDTAPRRNPDASDPDASSDA